VIAVVARRVVSSVPVLIGATILVFLILYLVPGDPAEVLLFGSSPTPEQVEELREQLGLNRPLPVQYVDYLGNVVQGDLGRSFATNRAVSDEILERFPSTLLLTLAALGVGALIGVPLGIIAGLRPGSWINTLSLGFAVLGTAIPYFWFALLLVLVFAVELQWLPSLGSGSPEAIILPAVSLGWGLAAIIARLLSNNLNAIYHQPYMQVARSKGLSERAMLMKHALKNALIPVVTILGLQFGNLIAGAVVIEYIFGRRGIGSYLIAAIQAKNIPAVQGTILFIVVIYIVINLLVDIAYSVLDPRIRLAWSGAR
jgi:ABC-type dipeptide/oligopeptide/nickel transport system permease component